AGPPVVKVAQGYITAGAGGQGVSDLYGNIVNREAGRSGRLLQTLNERYGRPVVPEDIVDQIQGPARRVGEPKPFYSRLDMLGPDYDRAISNASAVDTEPIANRLDALITMNTGDTRAALVKVRNMLNIEGTDVLDPHPGKLQAVRTEVRNMGSDINTPKATKGLLSSLYGDISNEMHAKIPGIRE